MLTRLKITTIAFLFCSTTIFSQLPASTIKFPDNKNSVEIPFTRFRGWIILQIKVNDHEPMSFILDTGAPVALFADKNVTEKLGLNIVRQVMVAGGDGQPSKKTPLAGGIKFAIGDIVLENCSAVIGAASETISGVDGVIGKYLFENAVVQINWELSKLIITKPEHFNYSGDGAIIPIELASTGHIYGKLTVEKNGKKKTVKAIFDTGNRSSAEINNIRPGEIYSDEQAIKNIITGWGANGASYGDITRVNISIGDISFSEVVVASKKSNGMLNKQGIDGNIGLSVLEKFNLTFDYGKGRIIFEKNAQYNKEFFYNRSGIQLHPARKNDQILIAGVIPDSPAAESGLISGEKITAINGKLISFYSSDEIDNLITGKNTDTIELDIKGSETTRKIKIVMEKLI